MVRAKSRYIIIEIESEIECSVTKDSLYKLCYDLLLTNYGEIKLSEFVYFQLIEHLPANNVFMIQVPRSVCSELVSAFCLCGTLNQFRCKFNVLFVSGSIRSAKKRIIKRLKYKIVKKEK
ncbi:Ribonuclease P protein component 2 [Astathelohania contejeani]|uniref:Ribonuclease P/MRP protein subunit POP5 n=1 Tax=Astathelohania contejeani TaxID=164912 RepID=A0ABQ7HXB4_9MICR|nr:Ribonuclease P protein component 2 [Thelohania contejeani]